jgi:hypothetical protein
MSATDYRHDATRLNNLLKAGKCKLRYFTRWKEHGRFQWLLSG